MTFPSLPEEDRVFLIDAVATSDTSLVASAGYAAAPDAVSSRIYLNFGDWWGAHEVPDDFIVSVAFRDGVLFGLGKNGLVKFAGQPGQAFTRESIKGQFRSFTIAECDARGHLTKVRATPLGFVACGWGGQLYRLGAGTWASLTSSDAAFDDIDLIDVDGTPSGELYAVGLGGSVLYFDGQKWAPEDLPTNTHFYAVRCLSNGWVLVGGAHGALYLGRHGAWQQIESQQDGNFWAMEELGGAVYLSYADRQLFRWSSGQLSELALGSTSRTHKLSAGPTTLLSCGSNALLRFDGVAWSALDCPDMA